jgi:hypothetical protein
MHSLTPAVRLAVYLLLLGLVWLPSSSGQELPKFSDAPHLYWEHNPKDAVTQALARLSTQSFTGTEQEVLAQLLKELRIPISSQLWVYSATSLQSGLIRPDNPRALYFNEETYIGYVPRGRLELVSIDPVAGPIFYIVSRTASGQLQAERSQRCMNCHAGNAMHRLPGFFTESVIASTSGGSLDGFRRDLVGHTVKLEDRFGGWHITGPHAKDFPLANLMGEGQGARLTRLANAPGQRFEPSSYLTQTSDILPHLIHEHQLEFHNLITRSVYRTREATADGRVDSTESTTLNSVARDMVRYLLFANEAKLPSRGIKPDESYQRDFLSLKKASRSGTSLRDLDLRSRLFRHRCSYMIYTPSFAALPTEIRDRIITGLQRALSDAGLPEFSYLPLAERRAIRQILSETLQL